MTPAHLVLRGEQRRAGREGPDACSSSGHTWVFAGGLTNVGVTVTVTDTQTDERRPTRTRRQRLRADPGHGSVFDMPVKGF
jgi:hypothetical protein